ncbi:MAG: aminopeptidase [Deltaproteobacteria bacterium]|nr:aminopeptidase [Deltaproteobacteria bacterium]MBW1961852.1 aminopeptidase [Deltaproteobacteria bacterium]MBW2153257.1 aminopeptidase [Deltaproteobacteria bacterium]
MSVSARIIDLSRTAELIIRRLLAVKPHEEVLLIADTETDMEMVYSLTSAVRSIGCEYTIAVMPSRTGQPHMSNVIPKVIEKAFEGADVAIGLTRTSFGPSLAPIQSELVFKKKKLRYYSMALRNSESMMRGGALADYEKLRKTAARLKKILESGLRLTIRTELGTDFSAEIPKVEDSPEFPGPFVRVEDGWADKPGEEAAFPDGEVFFAPREYSARGRLVIDGPIEYVGISSEPIEVIVQKGRIVEVNGRSAEARRLKELVRSIEDAEVIGEVAIGINPESLRDGSAQEEKKALGNCHIGFGIARGFAGTWMAKHKNFIHSDMIIRDVEVSVDGKVVVKKNKIIC